MRQRVRKPAGSSPAAAAPKESDIVILAAEDTLLYPPRDGNGINLMGNFGIKSGASMHKIYHTKSFLSAPFESDGEEDGITITQSIEVRIPGNKLEQKEFLQGWLGVNCYVFHKSCKDDFWEVIGTPCAPVQIMPTKQDNNDGRFFTVNFQQFAKSELLPANYSGAIIEADPTAIADAAAVAVDGETSLQYKLPSLDVTAAVSFDSLSNLDQGQFITIYGAGGADPATISSGDAGAATVVLKSGTQWTGLEEAAIEFQYFDAGATKYLIEVSRS
ncbi:hypothetical protein [Pustulibacterium marinum]|nr:hypothetical protein [Pustulibacterium marinum]